MLKTIHNNKLFMVTQPDHGQIAGYLAAHWGNEEFNAPGYFHNSNDHDRLRDEVVLAVSEHDNGWWEWEAIPELSKNVQGTYFVKFVTPCRRNRPPVRRVSPDRRPSTLDRYGNAHPWRRQTDGSRNTFGSCTTEAMS